MTTAYHPNLWSNLTCSVHEGHSAERDLRAVGQEGLTQRWGRVRVGSPERYRSLQTGPTIQCVRCSDEP
jgi:hypothetical protein